MTDATTGRRKYVYLGENGTPESHSEYARVIADWISRGRTIDFEPSARREKRDRGRDRGTVAERCIAFVLDRGQISPTLLPQKHLVREVLSNEEFAGRGLGGRFLWMLPTNSRRGYVASLEDGKTTLITLTPLAHMAT